MGELVDQKIGNVGELKLDFEAGKLKLSILAEEKLLNDGVIAQESVAVLVTPQVFIKLLEDAIPGDLDNAVLDALAAAFIPKA